MNTNEIKLRVELAQEGDQDSFEQLFEAFHDRIANYAFRRVLDANVADDIAATVFLKVIKGLPRFVWKHEHSFSGWIFRIASNEVNQYLRKGKHYTSLSSEVIESMQKDMDRSDAQQKSIEAELDQNSDFVELNKHIIKLKPKQQDMIHMYYFENLSHGEIATALKMREGAVRVAIHRSIESLRKTIADNQILQERSAS